MRSKLFSAISSASAITLALYLVPVLIDHNSSLNLGSTTFAKGGNGGGNGGNGGGHGGGHGNGGGHGSGHNDAGGLADSDHTNGRGLGHRKGHHDHDQELADDLESDGNKLGRLNAAHASLNGRRNASSNSTVGQIHLYEQAVLEARELEGLTLDGRSNSEVAEEAAVAELAKIANQDFNPEVVAAVNDLLGIPDTEPTVSDGEPEL